MTYYMTETVNNKTQYFLMMENVTLSNGQVINYKKKVTKAEYNNYLKAKDFVSRLGVQ